MMTTPPKHTLFAMVAAIAVAAAGTAQATAGEPLACSFRLGETCGVTQPATSDAAAGAIIPGSVSGSDAGTGTNPAGTPGTLQLAAGSCGSAAAAAAAAQGGKVIGSPRKVKQGNQTMCIVTVLIKDPTGNSPPTRRQITVPAN